jgi:RNA polymerase sigma factor (sigma-70 family)
MEGAIVVSETQPSLEALYRADSDRLWRALFAFSGDAEISSDALAEAYAQVIRRGDAVRDPQAWTWRAAFRLASGSLKSKRQAVAAPAADPIHTDRYGDPDLVAALAKLAPGQRAAVVLFYYADLPVAEIAHRLGTNSLAVRANLSRGRRRLRELLGERDG